MSELENTPRVNTCGLGLTISRTKWSATQVRMRAHHLQIGLTQPSCVTILGFAPIGAMVSPNSS
ncbi:hypothetical protein CONPUDRAFT_84055 [Coniophora puteana RWD-64-598 SS2]|uniref:Uncharacterized protein n=1 Tax=Coniophora puteana (strain RWD-64-598) TaxID=741705 RepID=A0A5M3MF30_CONPW|nr:uncharacterized protein CONPUDRAFT_84055 [Coniophora puteana RWD-64-598 SS2]EIW77616.1 hypothetical protein CONPUDRAFT_84055 [Coniophora puteana RWD-64-598 SS2]